MDKYEYNLKLDQIKALSAEEGYMSAAEIADSINWNKIKNVNTLVKITHLDGDLSQSVYNHPADW